MKAIKLRIFGKQIPTKGRLQFYRDMIKEGFNYPYLIRERDIKNHGKIYKLPIKPAVVEIACPLDIGKLLQADGPRPLRPVLPIIDLAIKRKDMKPSISHINGEAWANIRKKMQKIFLQPTSAQRFYKEELEVCERFVKFLDDQQDEEDVIRDFRSAACLFGSESIGKILIGANLRSFESSNSLGKKLSKNLDKLFELTAAGTFDKPWSTKIETKLYKQWIQQYQISQSMIRELIMVYGFSKEHNTFFNQLLKEKELDVDEAVSFAEELFIAGVESTGNALSFLMHHLGSNPEIQEKLYEELKTMGTTHPDVEQYKAMRYLQACVKESMRLSPPVIGTIRTTTKDITLQGYNIPAGMMVQTCGDVISKDPALFADPDSYMPERWLSSQRPPPFSHIPFGHGPRMCIGRRFAVQEMSMAAMMVILKFKVESLVEGCITSRWKIFYTPDCEVNLRLKKRM